MVDFSQLGSVVGEAHRQLIEIYYILLPIFFMTAIASVWFTSPTGSPEFVTKLKRAIVATLLLVGFPEITDTILFITSWVANEVSGLDGLDATIKMAKERLENYPEDESSILFGFNDLLVSALTYLAYVILYLSRYIMVALYHVSWLFLCCIAPLILSLHVFSSRMTVGLFRSLAEIASWKVVWAVLALMLKSLPYGQVWMDGAWITQVFMCLTISLCMLGTPLVVRALAGSGFTAFAGGLTPAIATLAAVAPAKAFAATQAGRSFLGHGANLFRSFNSKLGSGSMQMPISPFRKQQNAQKMLPGSERKLLPPSNVIYSPPPPSKPIPIPPHERKNQFDRTDR